MRQTRLLSATALATSLLISTAAFAQTTPAQSDSTVSSPATSDADQRVDQSTTGDEIVITGSRIRTPNAESVSPVTSVTGAELTQTARISVGDALNDLPQLRTTLGSQNSITGSLGLRGITALDLRGLGTTRTLTLVNGRREVAADIINNRAIVDTSAFPSDLIERVDVLTGGASSVYGSDAVAGVVNFILKDNYDGLALHAQSGVTIPWGDAGTQLVSVVGGKNFDEGRGNIAINAEYAHQSRYYASGRPDYRSANGFVITGRTVSRIASISAISARPRSRSVASLASVTATPQRHVAWTATPTRPLAVPLPARSCSSRAARLRRRPASAWAWGRTAASSAAMAIPAAKASC
jgi:outer membrane receptor protein involved in Fe transport